MASMAGIGLFGLGLVLYLAGIWLGGWEVMDAAQCGFHLLAIGFYGYLLRTKPKIKTLPQGRQLSTILKIGPTKLANNLVGAVKLTLALTSIGMSPIDQSTIMLQILYLIWLLAIVFVPRSDKTIATLYLSASLNP